MKILFFTVLACGLFSHQSYSQDESASKNDIHVQAEGDSLRPLLTGKEAWLSKPGYRGEVYSHCERSNPNDEILILSHFKITDVRVIKDQWLHWYDSALKVVINMQDDSGHCYALDPQTFQEEYSLVSPFKLYGDWSAKVWKAIRDGKVFVGMTKTQAKMAWGEPSDVNSTTTKHGTSEQWVYDGGYLYFDGNRLTTIQH